MKANEIAVITPSCCSAITFNIINIWSFQTHFCSAHHSNACSLIILNTETNKTGCRDQVLELPSLLKKSPSVAYTTKLCLLLPAVSFSFCTVVPFQEKNPAIFLALRISPATREQCVPFLLGRADKPLPGRTFSLLCNPSEGSTATSSNSAFK